MKIKPVLGDFTLDGIEWIESSEKRALAAHRVPGLDGDYVQDLGSFANRIVIAGSKSGDDARDAFLTAMRERFAKGEPTTFVADINTATDITDVVFEDLQVAEVAGSVSTFRYVVTLRKYVKPPDPPATGGLDGGILDDASSAVDALDAIDALASTPDIGNPTAPLGGAVDGVVGATSGLGGIVDTLKELFG